MVFRYKCTYQACGRIWNGAFERCQKCGRPTVMVDSRGNIVADARRRRRD